MIITMYFVYLLLLSNKSIYTRSSPRLKRRLQDHKEGKCSSTRDLRPVQLIWYCSFKSKAQALSFEEYLKSGSGRAFRNKRLIG